MTAEFRRGDVFYADLNPVVGSEQAGRRPVLIIQNDVGNRYSQTVIVAAITSSVGKKPYPTEVRLAAGAGGLTKDSAIRLDQIRTLDKQRLTQFLGHLDAYLMRPVDEAIKVSLGLVPV
jgi:mRNA interferase MazF